MNHVIFLNGIWSDNQVEAVRSIGPYQLKHWIAKFGFDSQVIDFCQLLSGSDIIELLEHFIDRHTLVIGISTNFISTPTPKQIQEAIRYIRIHYPKIEILTGAGASNAGIVLKYFVGFSEDRFVRWLQAKQGIYNENNKLFDITELDHRFDQKDCITDNEVLPIELGRGCMFKCTFCNTPNKGKRKGTYQRKYELILDEIQWNKEQFGITKYNFLDDTANEDPIKLKNLSNIKRNLGFDIMWNAYIRADLIWSKPETAEYLLESGMRSCYMGIETFNREAGDAVGKGWAARHGKDFLPILYKDIFKEKVNLFCSFIIGLPFETEESIRETFEWCSEHDLGFHCMHPLGILSGTTLAQEPHKLKYIMRKDVGMLKELFWEQYGMHTKNRLSSWDLFNYVSIGFDMEEIRYLTHTQLPTDRVAAKVEQFTKQYVQRLKSL